MLSNFNLLPYTKAMHPTEPKFVTVSEDRSIRVWSLKDKRLLRTARIPGAGRSVAMHPTQDHVAVGGASPRPTPQVHPTIHL